MGTFGWSYPPGAENDPNAPYNQDDELIDEDGEEIADVVDVNFDDAYSVSSEIDGQVNSVYFDVGERNGKWFMSATIDCETASFTDSLVKDDGPYDSEEEAKRAGLNAAIEWMVNNQQPDWEIDSRLESE